MLDAEQEIAHKQAERDQFRQAGDALISKMRP